MDADSLRRGIVDHLRYSIGRPAAALNPEHYYRALALAVRDRMQDNRVASTQTSLDLGRKVTCYLSAEFLMGPQLGNNLLNLGIEDAARAALQELGLDLDEVLACEEEPGLGNGGLGRLAACYLDSLATLRTARHRLRHPLRVRHLRPGDPRRLAGREDRQLAGQRQPVGDRQAGRELPGQLGRPHRALRRRRRATTASGGCRDGCSRASPTTPRSRATACNTCNVLTLWSARAVESFALEAFNTGDYYRAVEDEVSSETVTKVLYPNDEPEVGKRLRLLQQYFFVSCSLQHILHIMDDLAGASVHELPQAVRGAAQRHPPLDRRRRADAAAGRRAPARLGRGVGHHRRDVRLHQPHAAARGAGDVAAGDVRRVAAPPPRDHLRDQPPLPRRGARAVPRRRRPVAAHVADRRGRRQERAHGAPGHRRQPRGQRRRRAALRTAQGQRAQGLLRDVAGAVLQQDQRRHPAALPGAVQPRPARPARPHDRRRLAHRPRPAP